MELDHDRLATRISLARWCKPGLNPKDGEGHTFSAARIPALMPRGQEDEDVFWLDRLLGGGITLPRRSEGDKKALTVLLTGPPGTGKSTLAMEMAYRWGRDHSVLYLTSEASASWLTQRALSYGWREAATRFHQDSDRCDGVRVVSIQDDELMVSNPSPDYLPTDVGPGSKLASGAAQLQRVRERIAAWASMALPRRVSQLSGGHLQRATFPIAIVDSLDSAEAGRSPELFRGYLQLLASGPRLVIIVLDTPGSKGAAPFWEYVCDIVIRVDRSYVNDMYMTRWLEIEKARYQQHAWGRHQMKIYEPPKLAKYTDEEPDAYHARLLRSFPYSIEGGVFIFPSIHFVLSCYKRTATHRNPEPVETPLPALNKLLNGGLPKGRCTAFLGCRGGHKSHLGYYHLLHRIKEGERGLVISLRDDEGFTRRAMEKILSEDLGMTPRQLSDWMREGRLEIMYFPPGYITPEEFFHRLMMGVYRMKKSGGEVSVLFNSLDQLGARFPLCAHETIFVPAMIHLLSAEDVTSIFVAAREPGQPTEYYGLESTAELILNFDRSPVSRDEYHETVRQSLGHIGKDVMLPPVLQTVTFEVSRFAGGQAAGAKAVLELVDGSSEALMELYGERGLFCFPLVVGVVSPINAET